MQLSGKITIRAPRGLCIASLQEADVLAAFLPGQVFVIPKAARHFDIEFQRDFGPIAVKLRGHLKIDEREPGTLYTFVMQAKHLLAGSANMDIEMRLTGNAPTELAYRGTLTGTGLAGRLMAEREDRVQARLDEMFAALKQRIEAERRVARA